MSLTATQTETAPAFELTRLDTKGSSHHSGYHLPTLPKATVTTGPASSSNGEPYARSRTSIEEEAHQPAPPADGTKKEYMRREFVQLAALCWGTFLCGWNDGTLGPMIPKIREAYNVGFTMVSLIFVVACIGYCTGAVFNAYFTDRIAFGKVLVLACCLQVVAYAIMSSAPPFPLFVIAFAINGVALALHNAQSNGYVATLNDHTKMGILHAAYGLGAFSAPLVATQFSQMERWSFHFLASLGITLSVAVVDTLVFKFKSQDECLVYIGQEVGEKNTSSDKSNVRQFMGIKAVHLLAAFALVYVGTEVTIGGWTVTYIIEERGGGPSAGYISSGFFGGLSLGRVALLWVNKKIGERRVVYLYTFLAIGLEIVVWFAPSLIGGAVAVSFVGFLMGPYYPIAMNHAGKILPRWLLTASIGWISGIGQAGSALLPFITGAFASKFGIASLQPFLVAMMVLMVILWALVPSHVQRRD
ncbi:major facilitator superfamily domain-containing protein [Pterulicium gracile]|uniref:Major facilitator superfamily domain-containing protein n=1 Tax=Pterulicium gracile TaxID=1884261 RepID=A0A5C3R0Q3_9AGAR|nr:major facilitator superfamily domain-containing protein [Pterula gracilis]